MRQKVFRISLAMLAESIVIALSPVVIFLMWKAGADDVTQGGVTFYVHYIAKWLRLALYFFFCYGMTEIAERIKHSSFSTYIKWDFVALLGLTFVAAEFRDTQYVAFVAGLPFCLLGVVTSFLTGRKLKVQTEVPIVHWMSVAYYAQSLRYLLFVLVILAQIFMLYRMDMDMALVRRYTWMASFFLLNPLFVISRAMLSFGLYQYKG